MSRLPHVTVTSVPFNLQPGLSELEVFQELQGLRFPRPGEFTLGEDGNGNGGGAQAAASAASDATTTAAAATTDGLGAIGGARLRQYMTLSGRVHSVRLPSFVLSAEVIFGMAGERPTIRHDAGTSAEPYVGGTLLAARRVVTMKGLVRGLDNLLFGQFK